MGLFNFSNNKNTNVVETTNFSIKDKIVKAFNFNASYSNQESQERSFKYKNTNSVNGLPVIDLFNATKDWVKFDVGDNFPTYILDMYVSSPINNAIINNKANMIAGKDIIINNNAQNEYEKVTNEALLKNIKKVIRKAAFDYELYGSFALELFYNGSILIKIENISPQNIRAKRPKNVDDPITHWYYSKDFLDTRVQQYLYEAYIPYGQRTENSVIYYYKDDNSQIDVYGLPSWLSAQKSILIDGKIADFHNSNLDNSFSPSTHLHFFTTLNQSDDEINTFAKELNNSFAGSKKAGKPFITSSDSPETAVQIRQIESSNLDKRFEQLQNSVINQILIGHSVTSPELVGVAIAGKLGTSSLIDSYNIFEKTVIGPKRKKLEEVFNTLFYENNVKSLIELTEYTLIS